MPNSWYLAVFFLGAVIVVADGQLIMRSAPVYLAEVYRSPESARRAASLVTLFFHLIMLGAVALVASVAIDPHGGVPAILKRLGILLILTAAGHGLTIVGLSRMREQQTSTDVAEASIAARRPLPEQPATRQTTDGCTADRQTVDQVRDADGGLWEKRPPDARASMPTSDSPRRR